MRPPTRGLSRAELAELLRDDAPAVAARLADPSAPVPPVRSFLHPLMGESDVVRVRLAVLGLVELRDALDAMEADDRALLALSRAFSREALRLGLRRTREAHGLLLAANELLDLARSPAWFRGDPALIANARDGVTRAFAFAFASGA